MMRCLKWNLHGRLGKYTESNVDFDCAMFRRNFLLCATSIRPLPFETLRRGCHAGVSTCCCIVISCFVPPLQRFHPFIGGFALQTLILLVLCSQGLLQAGTIAQRSPVFVLVPCCLIVHTAHRPPERVVVDGSFNHLFSTLPMDNCCIELPASEKKLPSAFLPVPSLFLVGWRGGNSDREPTGPFPPTLDPGARSIGSDRTRFEPGSVPLSTRVRTRLGFPSFLSRPVPSSTTSCFRKARIQGASRRAGARRGGAGAPRKGKNEDGGHARSVLGPGLVHATWKGPKRARRGPDETTLVGRRRQRHRRASRAHGRQEGRSELHVQPRRSTLRGGDFRTGPNEPDTRLGSRPAENDPSCRGHVDQVLHRQNLTSSGRVQPKDTDG
eukprot:scaffold2636_cov340-Pavlova_lutheri.AAC.34